MAVRRVAPNGGAEESGTALAKALKHESADITWREQKAWGAMMLRPGGAMLTRRCSIAAGHRFVRTATLLLLLAIGCAQNEVAHESASEKEPAEPFERYEQVTLSEAEQDDLLRAVRSVLGYPYVWGGDSVTSGFDCSGLIQWAYRELGVGRFRNGEAVYREIAAHELYQYNTLPLEDIDATRRGDFVFFDVNGDGRITHNAVLDRVDEQGQVWVYDAYSVAGAVVHRTVEDFWNKGPRFGRPLKTIPRASDDEGHAPR